MPKPERSVRMEKFPRLGCIIEDLLIMFCRLKSNKSRPLGQITSEGPMDASSVAQAIAKLNLPCLHQHSRYSG